MMSDDPEWTPLSELAEKLKHLRKFYPKKGEFEAAIEKALRSGKVPVRGVRVSQEPEGTCRAPRVEGDS